MTTETLKRLNQLNLDFYEQVGQSFSDTRAVEWPGWRQLIPLIKSLPQPLKVVDLGCGNARFYDFLLEILGKPEAINYLGMDSSQTLLDIAQQRHPNLKWQKTDLVGQLLQPQAQIFSQSDQFDLIVLFGVLHHLPSYRLREHLFSQLAKVMGSQSRIVFTTWQFMDQAILQQKVVNPELAGFVTAELDPGDQILDWQRGQTAYRYAHYFSNQEIEDLLKSANLKIDMTFLADGPSGKANKYYVAVI